MLKGSFLLLSLFTFSANALVETGNLSAYRPLHIDYSQYEQRALRDEGTQKFLGTSALRTARKYTEVMLPEATPWSSVEVMQERFEKIRDSRFMTLSREPDFPRRISWLYPKDGCFARAALFNRNAFQMFIPIPKKVFAFGNLRVKTSNARRGVVGWWYHVAPIVQVGETKYVLDPSIDHEKPLPLKDWLARMGKPERIKVAICNTGTYSPGSDCNKKTDGMELRALNTQKHYLQLEEQELRRMGRNAEDELGENPPWN